MVRGSHGPKALPRCTTLQRTQAGACWDCLILPRKGDSESASFMHKAAQDATGELKEGLLELIRVMKLFRDLVDTVSVNSPWLTPNAEVADSSTLFHTRQLIPAFHRCLQSLDDMTFEAWVHNATTNQVGSNVCFSPGSHPIMNASYPLPVCRLTARPVDDGAGRE